MDGAVSACRCLAFVGRATMLYSMSYSVCSFVINALYPKEAAAEEDVFNRPPPPPPGRRGTTVGRGPWKTEKGA